MFVYLDGQFHHQDEAKISIFDRGFLFGDGVFTTLKVENGKAEFLNRHLKRLYEQCNELNIEYPDIKNEIIDELIVKNLTFGDRFKLRITITGGHIKELGLPRRRGSVIMTLTPLEPNLKNSLRLSIFSSPIQTPHLHLKTLSYLTRLFVMQEAKNRGFDDAVVLDEKGYILETAIANIFWIVGNDFYTPSNHLACLPGITLEHIITKAKLKGYRIHYVSSTLQMIPNDAYIYCSGSLKGIVPVTEIENRKFLIKEISLN